APSRRSGSIPNHPNSGLQKAKFGSLSADFRAGVGALMLPERGAGDRDAARGDRHGPGPSRMFWRFRLEQMRLPGRIPSVSLTRGHIQVDFPPFEPVTLTPT